MKIAIMGFSGSGKSTLARCLGRHYSIPVYHLDRIHWLPGWKERERGLACAMIEDILTQPEWIIDGNYSHYQLDRRLAESDHIIYLGFSRWNCLWRVVKRRLTYHGRSRDDMGEGCLERLDAAFICWIMYQGRDRLHRQAYARFLKLYAEKVVILRNQREMDDYLQSLLANSIITQDGN